MEKGNEMTEEKNAAPTPEIARLKGLLARSELAHASAEAIQRAMGDEIDELRAEIARLREDAERGRWMINNGSWMRDQNESERTEKTWMYFRIQVADGADLSCLATRRAAIDVAKGGK